MTEGFEDYVIARGQSLLRFAYAAGVHVTADATVGKLVETK